MDEPSVFAETYDMITRVCVWVTKWFSKQISVANQWDHELINNQKT